MAKAKIDTREKALQAAEAEAQAPEASRQEVILSYIEREDIAKLGPRAIANLVIYNSGSVIGGWNRLSRTQAGIVLTNCPALVAVANDLGIGIGAADWGVPQLNAILERAYGGNFITTDNRQGNYVQVLKELLGMAHWHRNEVEARQQIVYTAKLEAIPHYVSRDPRSQDASDLQYASALGRNAEGVFSMIRLNIQAYSPEHFLRILWHADHRILIDLNHKQENAGIITRMLTENASHVLAGLEAYYKGDPAITPLLPQPLKEHLHDPDRARAWMFQVLNKQPAVHQSIVDAFIFAGHNHHLGSPTYLQNLEQEQRDIREAQDARLADGLIKDLAIFCNLLCTKVNRSHKDLTNHNPGLFFRYNSMHNAWALTYDQDSLNQQRVIIPMEHTPVFQDWLTKRDAVPEGGELPRVPSMDEVRASLQQYNRDLNVLLVRVINKYCEKHHIQPPRIDGDFGFRVEFFDGQQVSQFGAFIVLRADQFMGPISGLGAREEILGDLYKVARGLGVSVDKPLTRPFEAIGNIVSNNVTDRVIEALPDNVSRKILKLPSTLREYGYIMEGIGFSQLDPGANMSTMAVGSMYTRVHPMLSDRVRQRQYLGGGEGGFTRALGSGERSDPRLPRGDDQ